MFLILVSVMMDTEPIPEALGVKQEYTLDGDLNLSQGFMQTFIHTKG